MASKGVPFLLFQSSGFSDSKRAYLMRRLFQFSNLVWKISLEDQEPKVILEKEIADGRLQIENPCPNDSVIPV
jgi:hypothetical protein